MTVVSMQQSENGSIALIIASVWTGLIHLALGVLGTFVLKRFPTSFSVGFFLGVLVVLANQNIILFASFHKYGQGSTRSNQVFASLGIVLFVVLTFMSLLLVHFKHEVVVSPVDNGLGGSTPTEDEGEENRSNTEGSVQP
jgi:zinc transporter ZupT